MAGGLFISYRRSDSADFSGRVADFFEYRYPDVRVFFDMVAIEPGEDFVKAIERRIASSEVVLAMIGETWLSAADSAGKRRLDDPGDFVRLELASALSTGTRIIPVLLENARMPGEDELPEPLKGLARCNAQFIRGQAFKRDAEHLGEFIREFLQNSAKPMQVAPQPVQRQVDSPVKQALFSAYESYVNTAPEGGFITVENPAGQWIQFASDGADEDEGMINFPIAGLAPHQQETARRLLLESVDASTDTILDDDMTIVISAPNEAAYLTRITMDIYEHVYGALPASPFITRVEA
ncbi:MAG: toll/interleukin-1 receptor domain-containing protein [Pseudomonadota bacterium]